MGVVPPSNRHGAQALSVRCVTPGKLCLIWRTSLVWQLNQEQSKYAYEHIENEFQADAKIMFPDRGESSEKADVSVLTAMQMSSINSEKASPTEEDTQLLRAWLIKGS